VCVAPRDHRRLRLQIAGTGIEAPPQSKRLRTIERRDPRAGREMGVEASNVGVGSGVRRRARLRVRCVEGRMKDGFYEK